MAWIMKLIIIVSILMPSLAVARTLKPLSLRDLGVVYFRVLEVSGDVYFSRPLSGEFRRAKVGRAIPDGSILRVDRNSKITIEAEDNLGREGIRIKRTRLSIRVPVIMRLGRNSFRRISTTSKMLTQFDSTIRRSADESEKLVKKLSDAWKDMAAMMSPDQAVDRNILKQIVDALNKGKKEEDVGISVIQGKIDFVTPEDRQLLLTDKMPADMQLTWQREKAQPVDLMKYDVFFWRQGEPKERVGIASGNKYRVQIDRPGKYYMQVESVDGVYRSKLRVVEVKFKEAALKDKAEIVDKGRDAAITATLSRRISPLAPDRNLIWSGDGRWPIFEFEWTRPDICSMDVVYEFNVNDPQKKQIYKRTLNKETYQWQPPDNLFGQFYWDVRVIGCKDSESKIVQLEVNTIPRGLEFLKTEHATDLLGKITQPRFNGTIFFESF
jgi:hypothetical protein